jgi:tetratricopeptide (TPR) repeat protein
MTGIPIQKVVVQSATSVEPPEKSGNGTTSVVPSAGSKTALQRLRPALLIAFLIFLALPAHATAQSAKELLGDGRVDEAISVLRQQTTQSPSAAREAEERNLLCRAYFMVEDWDHGIQECERAVSLAPDNSVYHLWLGRVYGEKAERSGFLSAAGMAKKVRSEFERAVQLGPQNWEARSDLAEFYLEAPGIVGGGKDKALAQADAMSAVNPAMAHYISGRIAEKNKDGAAAEREYRTAIEASQGGALAWLNLALFYRHENRSPPRSPRIPARWRRPPAAHQSRFQARHRTDSQIPRLDAGRAGPHLQSTLLIRRAAGKAG